MSESSTTRTLRNPQSPLRPIAMSGADHDIDSSTCPAKPSQPMLQTVDARTEWRRPPIWISAAALLFVLCVLAGGLLAACGLLSAALITVPPAVVSGLALAVFDDLSSAT